VKSAAGLATQRGHARIRPMVAKGERGSCARAKRLARRGWRRGVWGGGGALGRGGGGGGGGGGVGGGGGEALAPQAKRGVCPRFAHGASSALLRASTRVPEPGSVPRAGSRHYVCQWHNPLAIEKRRAEASPCRMAVGEPPPIGASRNPLSRGFMDVPPARCVAARCHGFTTEGRKSARRRGTPALPSLPFNLLN